MEAGYPNQTAKTTRENRKCNEAIQSGRKIGEKALRKPVSKRNCFTQSDFFIDFRVFQKNRFVEYMEVKSKMIQEFRVHEKDTGSADVQIALLTHRINQLTEHLQKNIKDHSSRRGLLKMVSQRRRLLDYLHTTDSNRYQALTKKLKLRK